MAMKTKQSPGSSSDSEGTPNVQEFFEEKCVLVIGATGFLGKVLVEKLLRSCPGIQTLFILLSLSENDEVTDIYKDFLESRVFDRLRNDQPDTLQKIVFFEGYIADYEFGLESIIYRKIIKEVSFVYHCESNNQFDEDPVYTINANLLGVKRILQFCEECEVIEAFVYVSTAFSFCNYLEIPEQIHPEMANFREIFDALQSMNSDQFRSVCKHYLQGRQSVYQLSKALEETLIVLPKSVPAIIVRPSILTASINDPFPGWIENFNAPSRFLAECGKGIVRTLLVKDNVYADLIPVDTVANTLIIAAHFKAVKSDLDKPLRLSTTNGVPIINCTYPKNNQITWKRMIEICLPLLVRYPSMEVYGKPGCTVTDNLFWYNLCRLMSHYVPAVLIDVARCLALKKPQMIGYYKSIHQAMDHFKYYTMYPLFINAPNMRLLERQINPEDAEIFPIDLSTLDWTAYMKNYVLGIRRFLLKESEESLPAARTKMIRIHYLWMALKLSFIFGIFLSIFWR